MLEGSIISEKIVLKKFLGFLPAKYHESIPSQCQIRCHHSEMYCLGVMTADHTMAPQDGYNMLLQSPVDDSSS